jgi:hypothetical protein
MDSTAAIINELLGEPDLCGCEHPMSEHAACAIDPHGPWHQVKHKCRLCCCLLDAGLEGEHSPWQHLRECDTPEVRKWLDLYEILPDAMHYSP